MTNPIAIKDGLLDTESLQKWLNFARPGDVEKWLKKHKVPYFPGKGGLPCTTIEAVNSRLIHSKSANDVEF